MEHFSLLNFLTISVPEEFLMALFAWAILGKKDTVKFINVIYVTLITALAFSLIQFFLFSNASVVVVVNLFLFTLIIYFFYRLNIYQAILGSLVTLVIMIAIQQVIVSIGITILGYSSNEFINSYKLKVLFFIPTLVVFTTLSIFVIKNKIKLPSFKKENKDSFDRSKIHYLVLQLSFTFLIILLNLRLYLYNKSQFSTYEITLLIINIVLVILFTVFIVISVFKMGSNIKKEESHKRELDSREIIQNIHYMCKLMDAKKYDDVKNILYQMKEEINEDILAPTAPNRNKSVK